MGNDGELRAILKQEGLKYTKHRASIMKVIAESGQPLSAEQVFLILQESGINVNLSTVYRTLESLASKNLIIKSNIGSDTKALFELNRMEHKHRLICIGCKKMFSVDGCPLEDYERRLHNKTGFDVTDHKLEIYGYCEECKPSGISSPVSVFRKKYIVGLSDADFKQRLKLSTLFGYFQDAASMAVENLGIGFNVMTEKFSVTWALVRIRVEIERYPKWNEEITVETWPQEPKKYDFDRDYAVLDSDGNVIIRAISTWILLDINTRELRKSEWIALKFPPFSKDRAIDCKLSKIRHSGELEMAYSKVIGYSDVDFNGHLNNSRYIDFIMDCFPVQSHKKYDVRSIEVNYINEAMPGEELVLYKDVSAVDANMIYIEGMNASGDKTVFKAQVQIVK